MKKVLFIDRDGTLVIEPPVDYQLDAYEKLEFYPKVFRNLGFIRSKLDFEFAMVTNQDGLGTSSFPEETFWPVHNLMMKTLENEGITFDEVFIDRSFPEDNAPTRKPRTGMLGKYLNNPEYDLAGSFVIAISFYPPFFTQSTGQAITQGNGSIFNGMMFIHFQIAFHPNG